MTARNAGHLAEAHSVADFMARNTRLNEREGAVGVWADAAMAGGVVAVAMSAVYVVLRIGGVL